jgi:hypothetical protein
MTLLKAHFGRESGGSVEFTYAQTGDLDFAQAAAGAASSRTERWSDGSDALLLTRDGGRTVQVLVTTPDGRRLNVVATAYPTSTQQEPPLTLGALAAAAKRFMSAA